MFSELKGGDQNLARGTQFPFEECGFVTGVFDSARGSGCMSITTKSLADGPDRTVQAVEDGGVSRFYSG